MNIIIKKVKLVAAPEPVFVGTRIRIKFDDPESLTWGIYALSLADGHEQVAVEWGDGMSEVVRANEQPLHTYSQPGEYDVRISDEISELRCSTKSPTAIFRTTYAKAIRGFVTNAALLVRLGFNGFYDAANLDTFHCEGSGVRELGANAFGMCPSLCGKIALPGVDSVKANSFVDCPNITELQFSKKNEEVISALEGYDTAFGAVNATVSFDLR